MSPQVEAALDEADAEFVATTRMLAEQWLALAADLDGWSSIS